MSPENVREQLLTGYRNILRGVDDERIENWASSEIENINRGALAAMVFYGACVRESMTRGIQDPIQAHWVAHSALSLFEEDDFDSVLYYMIGKPLPPKVTEIIEYYKINHQADATNALNLLNNMKVSFGDESDGEFDIDFGDDDTD